ncbi:MAG: phosphatase, partial [Cyanobacteria bacterium P01_D01_bin.1]
MSLNRRQLLLFLGATVGSSAFGPMGCGSNQTASDSSIPTNSAPNSVATTVDKAVEKAAKNPVAKPFEPIRSPMPYDAVKVSTDRQPLEYAQYAIQDDIVLPDGFTYDVIAAWGDPVGDSRFGYNND